MHVSYYNSCIELSLKFKNMQGMNYNACRRDAWFSTGGSLASQTYPTASEGKGLGKCLH